MPEIIRHINGETWLICGGRDFRDEQCFLLAMSQIMDLRGCPAKVVHGAARGADRMAGEWSRRMAITVVEVRADWKRHGHRAGPMRNSLMLELHKPQVVIAFPGGNGTRDMVAKAQAAPGVDVIEIKLNCATAPGTANESHSASATSPEAKQNEGQGE